MNAITRPFYPFWRAGSDNLRLAVSELQQQLEGYEHLYGLRKRERRKPDQRTFERTVEAIVCDLVHRQLTCPGGKIHITQSHQVLRRKSRYKGMALNKNLPNWLRNMATEEMDFLTYELGKRVVVIESDGSKATLKGQQTLIAAGPKILRRIRDCNFTLDDLAHNLDQEVVLLREKKKRSDQSGELLEYKDTIETDRMRSELCQINDSFASMDVECCDDEVDTSQRVLRRVFNNGSFEEGGRLYGGFWQNMKKEDREDCLLIDGEPLVELDYGQMSVNLLYGLAKTKPPVGDLYDLSEQSIPIECRPGIKKFVNALIASSKPLARMPKKTRETIPKRFSYREVKEAVKERHAQIADFFEVGVGPRLMRLESDIMTEVLLRLIDQRVTALPIHDAILVRRDRVPEAKAIMIEVFQEVVGVEPVVEASCS